MNTKDLIEIIVGVLAIGAAAVAIIRAFVRLETIEKWLDKHVEPHLNDGIKHLEKSTITSIKEEIADVKVDVGKLDVQMDSVQKSVDQTHGRLDILGMKMDFMIEGQKRNTKDLADK